MDSASSTPAGKQAKNTESTEASTETHRPSKSNGTNPSPPQKRMTLTKNGIVNFAFTDESIGYVRPHRRTPSDNTDPNLMGTPSSVWAAILSTNMTVREACKYSEVTEREQKMLRLKSLQKERLMKKDIYDAGYHADLLQAQGSPDTTFTKNEMAGFCAAASTTDIHMTDEETGSDLGTGLFRLGPEFDHIQISVLPHRDPESLYLDLVAKLPYSAVFCTTQARYTYITPPDIYTSKLYMNMDPESALSLEKQCGDPLQ